MSKTSHRQEEKSSKPKCRRHDPPVEMDEAILKVRFPKGHLAVRGYRCKDCGEEKLDPMEAQEASNLAEELGLYEPTGNLLTRKITKSGSQLALYIPKQIERELRLKKGMNVTIRLKGDEIVIAPA